MTLLSPERQAASDPRLGPGLGFGLVAEGGRIAVWSDAVSASSVPAVSVARSDRLGVVVYGRLFYLADLRRRWQLPDDHGTAASIVLDAVSRGGGDALRALEGEFSLVMWDHRNRSVTALRDPLGCYPLFWSARPGRVALSTSLRFAQDGDASEVRPDFVAEYLTRPFLAQSEPDSEDCAHAGVRRVRPGTLVTLSVADGSATRRRIWDWREQAVEPGTTQTDALAEQLRERLVPAIRERLDGTVAAHLSGGMDSTSVALLAQRERPAADPVHGISLVWDEIASLRGETRYVELARAAAPAIVPHDVQADRVLSFDSFRQDLRLEEPYPGLVNVARDDAMLASAERAGARTILSGDGGDDVLDIPPLHIAEALRRGRWITAWRESTRRARAQSTDVWGVLHEYGFAHVLPLSWQRRAHAVARGVPGRSERSALGPWIRPDFARRHDLEGRALEQRRRAFRSGPDISVSAALAGIQAKVGDPERWALASPRGLWLTHPFQDPRLIRLGLGIRRRGYRQDPAIQKPILAWAMRDVLPPEIAGRVGKAHLNEIYFRGLARNRVLLEKLAGDPAVRALEIFDTEALRTAIRQTALSAAWTAQGLLQLNLALSLTRWLATERGPARPIRRDAPLVDVAF